VAVHVAKKVMHDNWSPQHL